MHDIGVCVCVCASVTNDLIADIFRINNHVKLKFCSLIVQAIVQIKVLVVNLFYTWVTNHLTIAEQN